MLARSTKDMNQYVRIGDRLAKSVTIATRIHTSVTAATYCRPHCVYLAIALPAQIGQDSVVVDEQTLQALRTAFRATPNNIDLLLVLLRAHLGRGESRQGFELIGDIGMDEIQKSDDRLIVAQTALDAGHPQRALEFLADNQPEGQFLTAHALLALDRKTEAQKAYHRALEHNPTLEDPELAARLRSHEVDVEIGGRGGDSAPIKLRVISNDDTNQSELTRLLMPDEAQVTFDDVGGLDSLKKQIRKKIILPFQKPRLFERFRKRIGGGILLYGPPGCGKTLMARATAGEAKAQFFSVAISDVLDMYIGESEQKLHALFEKARHSAPAVLFFDEIEALGGKRQYTREGTASKLVSQFLSEMDGFARNNQGVLILGATNTPWAVDPAFRRPGRFDRVLFVPPPDRKARERILELHLEGKPSKGDLGLGFLASKTSGFSGADLMNLIESATDEAIEASLERGEEVPIAAEHLRVALNELKSTTLEWLTTARNYARYANESGQYDEVLDFLAKYGKGR